MDQINRSLKVVAAVIAAALLGGCSLFRGTPSSAPSPAQQAPSQAQGGSQPPAAAQPPSQPAPPRTHHLSPASRSLVDQAHAQLAQGELPAASSSLDRALRIEPSNPLLWIELGRLRLAENDAHQAESCGRKALALASGDHAAQAESGRLLVDALRAQHRNQDALEVERHYVK